MPAGILQGLRHALLGKGLAGARATEQAAKTRMFQEALAGGRTLPSATDYAKKDFLKYIETERPWAVGHWKTPPGESAPGAIKSLLLGSHGKDVLRSRYHLGGLLGKGGLLRGELASNPAMLDAMRNLRRSGMNMRDVRTLAWQLPFDALNKTFLLGAPAYGVYNAATAPPQPGVSRGKQIGKELGAAAGFALTGPLGLLGVLPGHMLGETAGGEVGSLLSGAPNNRPMPRQ